MNTVNINKSHFVIIGLNLLILKNNLSVFLFLITKVHYKLSLYMLKRGVMAMPYSNICINSVNVLLKLVISVMVIIRDNNQGQCPLRGRRPLGSYYLTIMDKYLIYSTYST